MWRRGQVIWSESEILAFYMSEKEKDVNPQDMAIESQSLNIQRWKLMELDGSGYL